MIRDVKLSAGARVVYMDLDDRARQEGWVRKTRFELSTCLGFSIRHWARYLNELVVAGYVEIDRSRVSSYFLTWIKLCKTDSGRDTGVLSQILREDTGVLPERTRASLPDLMVHGIDQYPMTKTQDGQVDRSTWVTRCSCGNYHPGPEPVRCACGAIHRPETGPLVDPIPETRMHLAAYVRQCGLCWPEPDDVICQRVLESAGGFVPLFQTLRWLLLDRRVGPTMSYAWFVVAVKRRESA